MTTQETRDRFAALSRRYFQAPLLDRVEIRACSAEEWQRAFDELRPAAFPVEGEVNMRQLFSDEERARAASLAETLGAEPLTHRVLFLEGDTLVGCFHGVQEPYGRYYMVYTLIHPSQQGRGLYKAFLARLLPLVKEAGFREIYSRHHADNNAVLVPKLKAGFFIAAFEVGANYGLLVHLRYPFNQDLRKLYGYRIGDAALGAELRDKGVLRSG